MSQDSYFDLNSGNPKKKSLSVVDQSGCRLFILVVCKYLSWIKVIFKNDKLLKKIKNK